MKRYATSAVIGACFLAFAQSSAAGFYVGLGGAYNAIDGDYDGNHVFSGGGEMLIVPKIDGAVGWSIQGGYNAGRWGIELDFSQSSHDGTWGLTKTDVEYSVFDVDFKYFFEKEEAFRPFLLAGINVDSVKVKGGALNALGFGGRGDATYGGAGINLGFGADYFITENVSTGLSAKYRFVTYTEAEGASSSGTLDKDLSGDGYSVLVNAAYHF